MIFIGLCESNACDACAVKISKLIIIKTISKDAQPGPKTARCLQDTKAAQSVKTVHHKKLWLQPWQFVSV